MLDTVDRDPARTPTAEAINEAHAVLESVERERVRQALAQTHNNRVHAAKLLGISRSTLYEKLKRYHLLGPLVADAQPPSYSRQIS